MSGIEMPHFMSPKTIRILKWILIIVISLAILLFFGGSIFSHYASRTVKSRLKTFGGSIGELDINLFTQGISIDDFKLTFPGDSNRTVATTAQIKTILLKNIDLYQLLINKDLHISEILIAEGNVQFNRKITFADTIANEKKNPLKGIFVDRLSLSQLYVSVFSDSSKEYSGTINAMLDGLQSSDTSDLADIKAYTLKDIDAKISNVLVSTSKFYQVKIGNIHADSENKKLDFDSIMLVPNYPKFKFARVAGKQIDRINTFIRKIEITGLRYNQLQDSVFLASNIQIISGEVYSFRDKRMMFNEKEVKPLPIAALKKIEFGIEVDTIQIKKSKITYEEFAPDGFNGGKIIFEDLNATLTNFTNRAYYNKQDHATLSARAKLMGKGLIEASFHLPFDEGKPYHVEGKIGKMALHHLNPALENLAFISIESGTLNEMIFNFDYNDRVSNGRLTINYENLKIDGLKKEKLRVINDLKTLLINTVIKNDKDRSVPTEKRTGAIAFERDRKRQVFNYWWKSLFSGIKSSVMEN